MVYTSDELNVNVEQRIENDIRSINIQKSSLKKTKRPYYLPRTDSYFRNLDHHVLAVYDICSIFADIIKMRAASHDADKYWECYKREAHVLNRHHILAKGNEIKDPNLFDILEMLADTLAKSYATKTLWFMPMQTAAWWQNVYNNTFNYMSKFIDNEKLELPVVEVLTARYER